MKSIKVYIVPILLSAMFGLLQTSCGSREVQTSAGYNVPPGSVEKISEADTVLKGFVSETGKNIPTSILQNAAGVAVFPDLTKAAFIAGGRHGTGVLLSREQNRWSLPVFASMTGASLGLQAGISMTDLVLVFQRPETISNLQQGASYTFGSDLTVAAGPYGGAADVTARKADVLVYKRTEGAFAGASLSGSRMSLDADKTYAYYVTPESQDVRGYYGVRKGALVADLLDNSARIKDVPPNASELRQTLDRVTGINR